MFVRFLVTAVGIVFTTIGAVNILYEVRRLFVEGKLLAEGVGGAAISLGLGLALLVVYA